jgi:branched-chain amino acid transport system ATP-binding protein
MLELRNVQAAYGKDIVLSDVSLSVRPGEVVGLLGRNGMGKTTTLKSILGLVTVRAGSIRLGEHELTRLAAHGIPHLGIGYVPQGQRVFADLTVRENLQLILRGRLNETHLAQVAQIFPTVRDHLDQRAGTLSGGEQQMLALSRTVLGSPQLLLLDEPTEGLMPSLTQRVEETLHRLKQDGIGILLTEQQPTRALAACDRFYVIEKGRTVAEDASGCIRAFHT